MIDAAGPRASCCSLDGEAAAPERAPWGGRSPSQGVEEPITDVRTPIASGQERASLRVRPLGDRYPKGGDARSVAP